MSDIKNGKVYGSKAAAYQVLVQGAEPIKFNVLGEPIERLKELVAEFAYHGGEFTFENALTGNTDRGADIRGFFFDSAQQAEAKGWTQAEHDFVIEKLDRQCKMTPEYVWEITAKKAAKPWPTYDEVHHNAVAGLAEQLGLLSEALTYEKQNKARESVVKALSEKLAEAQAAAEDGEIVAV